MDEVKQETTRRQFLVSGTAAAACLGCSAFIRQTPTDAQIAATAGTITLDANATRKLSLIGGSYRVQVPNGPRLIILRGKEGLVAFSSACTHWGSDVSPDDRGDLVCPTHGSRFSQESGARLEGPARDPLAKYPVKQHAESGLITISLTAEPSPVG